MGATGGADHIRSSLSVVLTDAAPVSTAAVASSRPREHAEAALRHGSRRGDPIDPVRQRCRLQRADQSVLYLHATRQSIRPCRRCRTPHSTYR
jgi:hypothetical protein